MEKVIKNVDNHSDAEKVKKNYSECLLKIWEDLKNSEEQKKEIVSKHYNSVNNSVDNSDDNNSEDEWEEPDYVSEPEFMENINFIDKNQFERDLKKDDRRYEVYENSFIEF